MCGTPQQLMTELKTALLQLYGSRLHALCLFGSYARGEADAESDVDVLIVLDDFTRYGAEVDRTSELVASLSLHYAVSISTVFVRRADWLHGDSPFLANVRKEAIAA
ncbi:MAG: nucleotidyltransferase domain-containing protein [Planctomycetota bacterium]